MISNKEINAEELATLRNSSYFQSLYSSESGSSSATKSSSMQTTPLKKQPGSNQSIDGKNQSVQEKIINGVKNLFGYGPSTFNSELESTTN